MNCHLTRQGQGFGDRSTRKGVVNTDGVLPSPSLQGSDKSIALYLLSLSFSLHDNIVGCSDIQAPSHLLL